MKIIDRQVAFVTGGASGIGAAIVKRLLQDGASVAIADLNSELAEELIQAADAQDRCNFIKCDVSCSKAVDAAIQETVDRYAGIDTVVNCAGMNIFGDTLRLDEDDWDKVVAVNLKSVYLVCKYSLPYLIRSDNGTIINIASLSGVGGDYGFAAYNAAKGGVINYTRNLALDYAKHGVRVNAISPGPVDTPILSGVKENKPLFKAWEKSVPMGRFALPEEIANVAAFLWSQQASFITGANVPVDGGLGAATGQPDILQYEV